MMKNSSIVKKGLMQIHKSLLVAVLAVAALGILGGLTACHEQPITPSGGSSGLTPSTPSKITVTVQGDANVKGVPFTLTATGKKWADIKTDAKAKITFKEGYELDSYRVSTKDGEYITDGYVFTKDTTIFVVSKEAGTPSTPTVTITVKGDSNITAIPKKSLMVTKGERWKTVQAKITVPTSFTPNYEFDKWTLEGKTEAIPDAYEFKDNTIIVAVSKAKGTTPAPTPLKNFITTETNGALTITGYNGEPPAILVIPEKIDGKPVVSIGKKAFMEKTSIQKVIFPKSLKTIENGTRNFNSEKYEGAFSDCTNLTELNFSECTELTSIGWYAFSGCSGITALTLPSKLTSIGDFAFSGCSGITGELDLSHLTKLEYLSGFNETGITAVKFPANLKTIGRHAFFRCSGIRALTLPDSLTSIGWYAFSGCSGITALTLPSKLTSIGDLAFSGCKIKTLEVGMKDISFTAEDVFGDSRTSITTLTLQEGVQTIGGYAFYGCINIGDIDLSKCNQLTTIDEKAFLGCKKATVKLPASITEIKEYAFGAKHAWWINPETNVGEYTESFCKEVQVPGNPGEADYDRISGLVKKNGIYASYSENYYPEDRIQPIPTP
ncbi:MAG: leucine-rich repeat protein [Treponema phagedenis]|uniref:leucine-rich repeat domain-containing protein n=1 Tax=Treponema phagedenis TaxID=162 RepID=UPI003133D116